MLPVVDIGGYIRAAKGQGQGQGQRLQDIPEVKDAARQVHDVISEHGFCYLTNHGVPQDVVNGVLEAAKKFFLLPGDVKRKYERVGKLNRGWTGNRQERINPQRTLPDVKEAFNFSPNEGALFPTEEVPEMEPRFRECFQLCTDLSYYVLDLFGIALEFEDYLFLRNCHRLSGQKGSYNALRTLYYPLNSACKAGQINCGEHSDYGSLTILFQDDIGGLQIEGKDGEWRDVRPIEGAVVINIGDLMQRWTADKYPSTNHRVVLPPEAVGREGARQSLAFFAQPDDDTVISCLDGSHKYPPITSYQFLMQRYGFA